VTATIAVLGAASQVPVVVAPTAPCLNSRREPAWRYIRHVKTISQRELRDKHSEVMRDVEAGETYTITRRGVAVALVVPLRAATDLRCDRPATKRPTYADQPRVATSTPTTPLLEGLRGDR